MASLGSNEMLITSGKRNLRTYSRMYISVFLCSILMLITGIIGAWTSPMLQKLNSTEDNPLGRNLTDDESSWLASIPILGSIVGSLTFGALAQTLGRKVLLTSMAVPYLFFFVIMSFSKYFLLHIFARIFGGFGAGGIVAIVPLYICEVAIPEVRGRLIAFTFVALNVGTLITFCLAPFISFYYYHVSLAILPLSFLVLFPVFAVESPYYIMHTDPVRAEKLLQKLRGKYNVTKELQEMKVGLIKTCEGGFVDLFLIKGARKAILITLGLGTFMIFSGSFAILSYIHFIFDAAGSAWSGEINTIILGVVQLITSLVSSAVADHFDRKFLLTISYLLAALSQGVLGGYFVMRNNGLDTTSVLSWIPILSLTLFLIAFSFQVTLGGLIAGEIFPSRVKNLANAICSVYAASIGFVIIFLFQRMRNAFGLGGCFWIFAGFGICASIFVMTVMVETRGKTLQQIEDELNGIPCLSNNMLSKNVYGTINNEYIFVIW